MSAEITENVGQGFSVANSKSKPKGLPYREIKNQYKKRTRLKEFSYKGRHRYFLTLCTFNNKNIFSSKALITWVITVLRKKSEIFKFKVWAYCFMPDHLHLLLEGGEDDSDLIKFISSFKQYTGFYYKKKSGYKLWQVNFYEHILRTEEDTYKVVYYIFNNPVRKGLVDDYIKYKFLGSFEFDIQQN